MPLSAAFDFFSSFHYEKKYYIQSFYPIISFFSFISFFSLFHLSPVNSLSTPIFVMLLITQLNITKSQAT